MTFVRAVFIACLAVVLFAASHQASIAETRVALVIGNGAYASQPLTNPPNDAALMAETLRDVGFEVIEEIDASARDMKRAVRRFGRLLADAGEDAVGFVYYAGHGIQTKGENYMIPVGAIIEDSIDVELEGLPASTVLSTLEGAGNRLNIVVMDACRNNPYKAATRSAGSGLARMDAPSGTLIAYSTAPGKVAADGRGRNSPYTRALARSIQTPGAKVEEVFKSVRVAVMDRTNGEQVPWESSSLTGDFFFLERAPEPVAQPEVSEPRAPDNTLEITFWNSIKDGESPALFESYLEQFPRGTFVGLAQAKIATLKQRKEAAARQSDTAFFQAIQNSTNKTDFQAYLTQYPNGTFAALAKARIAAIEEQEKKAIAAASSQAASKTAIDADTAFWNQVKDANTTAELQAYLDQFPSGKHAAIAQARIKGIEERRQVAALTPASGHPMDGEWSLEIATVGGYQNGSTEGYCSVAERGETKVTVLDGKFSTTVPSNKKGNMRVEGVFNNSGAAVIRWGNRRNRVRVETSGGEGSKAATAAGGWCRNEFTLKRLVSLTPASGHPMDGAWIMRIVAKDTFAANPIPPRYCATGESGEKQVTVSNGGFETTVVSSKGANGRVRATISQSGRATVDFMVPGTRNKVKVSFDVSSGQGARKVMAAPGWCYTEFSLERVGGG